MKPDNLKEATQQGTTEGRQHTVAVDSYSVLANRNTTLFSLVPTSTFGICVGH